MKTYLVAAEDRSFASSQNLRLMAEIPHSTCCLTKI